MRSNARTWERDARVGAGLVIVLAGAGCGAARPEPRAPAWEPEGQTKATVAKSRNRPLIVEWPAAERAALESSAQHGVVAVKYGEGTLELLSRCRVKGSYAFTAVTRKDDHVRIRTEDELRASMPAHAATLSAKLSQSGRLDVDMSIVGAYEAVFDPGTPLEGECVGATHLVIALTAGAFELSAGGGTEVSGGIGLAGAGVAAGTASSRETVSRDGDRALCKSSPGDKAPPPGCGALLRIEVQPVPVAAQQGARASALGSPLGPALLQPYAFFVVAAVPLGPPPPPTPVRTQLAHWAFGLGGTALAVTLSTGGVAWLIKGSSLDDSCTDNVCPTASKKNVSGYQTTAKIATITGIAGVGLMAVGTVLILTAPSTKAQVGLAVGPGSLGLGGSF